MLRTLIGRSPTREFHYRIVRLRLQGTQTRASSAPAGRRGNGEGASTSKQNPRIGDPPGDASWRQKWHRGRHSDARRPHQEQPCATRRNGWHRNPRSQFSPAPRQSPRWRPGVMDLRGPHPRRQARWTRRTPRRGSSPISRAPSSRATDPSFERSTSTAVDRTPGVHLVGHQERAGARGRGCP